MGPRRGADAALTALGPVAWGTTYAVTATLPHGPLLGSALRALPAGLALGLLTRWRPERAHWASLAILSGLNIGIFFPALYLGAQRLPGSVAAIVLAAQPSLTVFLAWGLLAQRPQPRLVATALAGIVGVAMVVLHPVARLDRVGLVAAAMATVSWSLATVLTARWGHAMPLLGSLAWQLLLGGSLDLLGALLFERPLPSLHPSDLAGYAYLSVVATAIAYGLWFRGLRRLPAAVAGMLGLLSPVVATLIDVTLVGQHLSWVQGAGIGLVLTGVAVAQAPGLRLWPVGGRGGA
jgi:probable blue pigment (indigoidine) exporter